MPLMVEPLAMKPGMAGYGVNGDPERIRALVRAVELGADVIKADPTDDLGDYPSVIEVAGPIPLLVRGGAAPRTRRCCSGPRRSCTRVPPGSCTAAT